MAGADAGEGRGETMSKIQKLRELVTEKDGKPPARDPEYLPQGAWPKNKPGWHYQRAGELGQWSYLGGNFEDAVAELSYYCADCGQVLGTERTAEVCPGCGGEWGSYNLQRGAGFVDQTRIL